LMVEAGRHVQNMAGVSERLLTILGKGEGAVRELVLGLRAQTCHDSNASRTTAKNVNATINFSVMSRRLDWPGFLNARDLGGLPLRSGGETRPGGLIRSALPGGPA